MLPTPPEPSSTHPGPPLPFCNSAVIGARYHHYDESYKEKDKSWTGSNKAKR